MPRSKAFTVALKAERKKFLGRTVRPKSKRAMLKGKKKPILALKRKIKK